MVDPTAFETGAATHVGRVRDHNEDNYLVKPALGLWAVADGMGGHLAGDVASASVVGALGRLGTSDSAASLLKACEALLAEANGELRVIAAQRGVTVVGTTIVALLIYDQYFACLWSGDSRAYLIRRGRISQITRDHTEAAELVAGGLLSEEEARTWPRRNVITRAIGAFETLQLDLETGELESGDIFVLCTDGLTAHVGEDEIQTRVSKCLAQDACRDLIELALERGGLDNVTVIVVHYRPDSERTVRLPGPYASGTRA